MTTGRARTWRRAAMAGVGMVLLGGCGLLDKPEPATPSPPPGPAVEAPPPRTALSDGAYCLLPTEAGFQQVSCATGKAFPNGAILADGSKVCFEIDRTSRTLLPIPCAGQGLATGPRAPGQGAVSILPPLPPGHIVEKPLDSATTSLCTEDTKDGLKMLVECSKLKGKSPPKPPPTLKLCERLINGLRYIVPCELGRALSSGNLMKRLTALVACPAAGRDARRALRPAPTRSAGCNLPPCC